MKKKFVIPNLGEFDADCGFIELKKGGGGMFAVGIGGVQSITATGDKKVEFIAFKDRTLAFVDSALGYPAFYPVHKVSLKRPVKAVLMDLDGTSVHSEEFWIWIIERTTASLLGDDNFRLSKDDIPYVSGHSVSEHLNYCIQKYCPKKDIAEARKFYFEHTHREMSEILAGRGKEGAFTPTPGLKDFLYALKERKIKVGLVTSGLYEKAWPEILDAFKTLKMGDPKDFYDAAITAGFPLRKGEAGTLGELSPKPHPWLYAETCVVGLNIPFEERDHVLGIEDSGAGVCAVKLAGFTTIGIGGGNIKESGTLPLCDEFFENFQQILDYIDGRK
ncbi:MAG: HAD hydrolase-like protein [Firmicutes bacterium]|nr:HAD hydrolase-like protein [Bacillota bacterium]